MLIYRYFQDRLVVGLWGNKVKVQFSKIGLKSGPGGGGVRGGELFSGRVEEGKRPLLQILAWRDVRKARLPLGISSATLGLGLLVGSELVDLLLVCSDNNKRCGVRGSSRVERSRAKRLC